MVERASGRVLLVSSAGGHFTELRLQAERHGLRREDRHWVVPRTAQTEDVLAGEAVTWMPRVESRQLGRAMVNLRAAIALHHRLRPRLVLSTGAAQAVPHLLAAAFHRTPVEYDESVARVDGPSLTGQIAARLPGAELMAPVPGWGGRWSYSGDLFDDFRTSAAQGRPVTSALVSLGTEHFAFPRAVEQVRALLPPDTVTWQVGNTDVVVDGVQLNRWLHPALLAAAMTTTAAVVLHGGAGSILTALACGRVPVVMSRSGARGEHVDEHQVRMCDALAARGLIVHVRPDEVLADAHLARAAGLVAAPARARTSPQPS